MFNFERYQVYEESPGQAPFEGNMNLAAVPKNMRMTDNFFWADWWSRIRDPWEIRWYIRNGKISIDFPDIDFEKVNTTDLHSINGVYVLRFYIEEIGARHHTEISLYKNPWTDRHSEVYILYASADLNKMTIQGRLVLRKGWNFLSMTTNPDWLHGSAISPVFFGRITQNINDFLRQGYRWYIGRWMN